MYRCAAAAVAAAAAALCLAAAALVFLFAVEGEGKRKCLFGGGRLLGKKPKFGSIDPAFLGPADDECAGVNNNRILFFG